MCIRDSCSTLSRPAGCWTGWWAISSARFCGARCAGACLPAAVSYTHLLRLLYVALTRAQDKLILTIPLGVTKTSDPLARAAVFLAAGAGAVSYTHLDVYKRQTVRGTARPLSF